MSSSTLLTPAVVVCAVLALAGTTWAAPGPPTGLRCEYQVDPIGLDCATPRFTWLVQDPARGAWQSAYQIQVATSRAALEAGQGLVWDSGRIESSTSHLVAYGGAPPASRGRYLWRVRTWDGAGNASPYSEPASWEMGLLAPGDWTAQWVGPSTDEAASPLEGAQWIWAGGEGDGARTLLRKAFDLPAGATVARATLSVAVDNTYSVFLNGERVGADEGWETPQSYDVTRLLKAGGNVLALEGVNEGGPCGAIAALVATLGSGETVRVATDDSWRGTGERATGWETLGFDDSDWQAPRVIAGWGGGPWARRGGQAGSRSTQLRTEIELRGAPVRARAYVTGLGLYELRVNGEKVGDEYLTPGWTYYGKRVQYRTYDVTDRLRAGDNALGAVLGNGWWGSTMAGNWQDGPPCFLLQLVVRYGDGSEEAFVTDDSWRWSPSPISANSLYHGESYDARMEQPGWDQPGFRPATPWTKVRRVSRTFDTLVAQQGPPIRKTAEFRPAEITEPKPGVWVVDFGQNLVGWCRLTVRGEAGSTVRIRHAEVLNPDGTIYTENYRSARVTDSYTLRGGGAETWEPRFTYRGFRYAELTGLPTAPTPETITAFMVHSDAPETGAFRSSNETLNAIQHNLLWGLKGNLHSVPTDCPQRDERLGWTGDAEAFAPTAAWNLEMAPFLDKWLRDLADSQLEDGAITDVAPAMGWGAAAPAWGDVITIVPWVLYQRYGDRRALEESYEPMRRWVEYMRAHSSGDLYERGGYGDWIAVERTPSEPIGSAYYYLSTRILADTAAVLGKPDDARSYGALAERIRAAFLAKHLDPESHQFPGATQTANVLPLAFGIVPPNLAPAVAANVRQNVLDHDSHLTTGFLGTGPLLPVLSDYGWHDLAYQVAGQRTYPSWGYMVEKGATTIWELWNSDTEGPGMNSRNHFALGAVGDWFYQYVLGLRPDPHKPGFQRFIVEPRPVGDLTWAEGHYDSVHGTISVRWLRSERGSLRVQVEVPANTAATVILPALGLDRITESDVPVTTNPSIGIGRIGKGKAELQIGSGIYDFTVAP